MGLNIIRERKVFFYTIFNILIQGNLYIFIAKSILLKPWLRCAYGVHWFYIWSLVYRLTESNNLYQTNASEDCFVSRSASAPTQLNVCRLPEQYDIRWIDPLLHIHLTFWNVASKLYWYFYTKGIFKRRISSNIKGREITWRKAY